jgi:iron complex transport system substrate-binding protein
MDVALVLGLPLVAGPGARGLAGQAFAPYQPAAALADVAKVTTYPEVNFEQIAAVNPDCIIDSAEADLRRYELLSQIAPTFNFNPVLYPPDAPVDWRGALLAVGESFGRGERAVAEIAAYDELAAALRGRLAERWAGATFVTLGSWQPGLVLVTDRNMHPALILADDLGLTPAPVMPERFEDRPNLSLERLDLLDADLLFVRVEAAEEGGGRDRATLDGVQASPLWQRLPAVAAGNVVEYDAELFYASPLTAAAFLDVVEAALLP